MGNCVSRSRLFHHTNEGHPEKRGAVSGLPRCPVFPIQEPTQSFWTYPPSSIATHISSDTFPSHADVVIIGSGISGASFARTLLDIDQERNDDSEPLRIVMLEAQETCSGATGRNGGHINPPAYHEYEDLKQSLGEVAAQKIVRFRLAHLDELLQVGETEAVDADCRQVHSVDVFFDQEVLAEAKRKLRIFEADMPGEAAAALLRVWEGEEARKRHNLSAQAVGCVTLRAGAVQPYRFVTNILSRLLEEYPKHFQLFTQTPCTSVTEPSSINPFYTLTTPRGQLTAPHVVHLTNAYVGGLVPALADVVYRVRETMSAQRPGRALHFQATSNSDARKIDEQRSYIFFDSPEQKGFDYLTHIPGGEREFMFGGGREALPETEVCRTSSRGMYDLHSAAHVSGALPIYFGAANWGAEAITATKAVVDDDAREDGELQIRSPWTPGRVKSLWSGVLSVSVDEFPWVGRIPSAISGRRLPMPGMTVSEKGKRTTRRTADPGEWMAAGYSGEGMVHAWLCARALALMVLGLENDRSAETEGGYGAGQTVEEWFPAAFRITEARLRTAREGMGLSGGEAVMRGGGGRMKLYKSI